MVAAVATGLNGAITGASLDQSIKQLPARHKIGAIAYSNYAQAADLGNGVLFYGLLGISAALVTILDAVLAYVLVTPVRYAFTIYIAALFSVLHSLATAKAAPTMFSQKRFVNDATALEKVFDKFEKWQTIRLVLQIITFISSLAFFLAYASI